MDKHVKREYSANPVEDGNGYLTGIRISEQIVTQSVDAAGRVRDREYEYDEDVLVVPVGRARNLVAEIMDLMAYYATGEAARERAEYPPRAESNMERLERQIEVCRVRTAKMQKLLNAAQDELTKAVVERNNYVRSEGAK